MITDTTNDGSLNFKKQIQRQHPVISALPDPDPHQEPDYELKWNLQYTCARFSSIKNVCDSRTSFYFMSLLKNNNMKQQIQPCLALGFTPVLEQYTHHKGRKSTSKSHDIQTRNKQLQCHQCLPHITKYMCDVTIQNSQQ